MKVAFYAYPSAFQNPGGGEIQLLKTMEYLRKAGVEVKKFDQWNDKLEDYDVLHVFGSVKMCVGLMNTARNKNVKVALSPIFWSSFKRALHESGSIRTKMELFLRHLAKMVFPKMPSGRRKTMTIADILFPNSEMEKEQLMRLFDIPEEKIYVVPNGVDARFKDADPKLFTDKYGIKDFVLYSGRIEPRKNQLNFIRAMKRTGKPAVFIGDAVSDYKEYYSECRKEAPDNMHFLGRLEHDSDILASAYAACDVFVLTSWFETPGLCALEAALAGAKVVITPEGSTREYFKDMVIYARPDDIEEISSSMEEAFGSAVTPELKEHVLENYIWDRVASRTKQGYEKILKGAK
ncbi:MAG: glycosyltransferase family 4 protein [Candidatus Tantalella remota]|nr:glycosyltransferase family 4 protein [Candidatus Tantalella remota]